jgi:hypothetical protein
VVNQAAAEKNPKNVGGPAAGEPVRTH